jgi:UDP-glucose 4-epimerase
MSETPLSFVAEDAKRRERFVVLGGLGFMGSRVCRELARAGARPVIFDRPAASRALIGELANELEIIEGDIKRPEDVLGAIAEADTVINLIHTTVPGSSMNDPVYDVVSNVAASVNWLRRLPETKVRRLIYVSSGGTVYGRPLTNPIDETHPTDPISSYGITKLTIEKYVALYSALYNVDYLILRPSNVYGVGQQLRTGQGVIGVLAERALRGEPLEIWGSGESRRDYLYVDDMVAALVALLAYRGPHKIFNISGGEGHSVLDIISMLRDQLGSLPEIRHHAARGFDVSHNVLDSSRLHNETLWRPTVNLSTGITRTLRWLQSLSKQKTAGN